MVIRRRWNVDQWRELESLNDGGDEHGGQEKCSAPAGKWNGLRTGFPTFCHSANRRCEGIN